MLKKLQNSACKIGNLSILLQINALCDIMGVSTESNIRKKYVNNMYNHGQHFICLKAGQ